eukprot:scaffold14521_cov121-Isochrysis_galbana.AAC.8
MPRPHACYTGFNCPPDARCVPVPLVQRSRIFNIGGVTWLVSLFPAGNVLPKVRNHNATAFVSVYIEIVGAAGLAAGWSRSAKVTAAIENANNQSRIARSERLTFDAACVDNGWNEFAPLTTICEEGSGFLQNGALILSFQFQHVRMH